MNPLQSLDQDISIKPWHLLLGGAAILAIALYFILRKETPIAAVLSSGRTISPSGSTCKKLGLQSGPIHEENELTAAVRSHQKKGWKIYKKPTGRSNYM